MDAPSLFDDVVAALQPTFRSVAPFILTRLLLRARIFDRAGMSVAELQRVMPILEAGFQESLTPAEFDSAMSRVRAVVQRRQQP